MNNYLNKHPVHFVCIQLGQTGHLWRIRFLGKLILPIPVHKTLHKQPPLRPLTEKKNSTKEHFSYAQYIQSAAFSASRFRRVSSTEAVQLVLKCTQIRHIFYLKICSFNTILKGLSQSRCPKLMPV